MADGHTWTTAAALEGLTLGERIVLVARMAVEAHLRELSAASSAGEAVVVRHRPAIGGAGGRVIPLDCPDRASRTTRGANV